MIRSKISRLGACGIATACLIGLPASAWGPHPEVDAARRHLVEVIHELENVERANPPGSFGGHTGKAMQLTQSALAEFDQGIAVRSRLP